MEKKLERAEESVKICKSNIENQEKKLEEANKKLAAIKSTIASINSTPSGELENLVSIDDKLMIIVEVHKAIILELQADLNINENNLYQLKSNVNTIT
jgi:prefoldin subunit 5